MRYDEFIVSLQFFLKSDSRSGCSPIPSLSPWRVSQIASPEAPLRLWYEGWRGTAGDFEEEEDECDGAAALVGKGGKKTYFGDDDNSDSEAERKKAKKAKKEAKKAKKEAKKAKKDKELSSLSSSSSAAKQQILSAPPAKRMGVVVEQAQRPTEAEVARNSRSRSAVLHLLRRETGWGPGERDAKGARTAGKG